MSDKKPRKDSWVTHLLDLLSGRVFSTFLDIYTRLLGPKGLESRITTLENFMKTDYEQKLKDAAENMKAALEAFKAYHEKVKTAFAELRTQAQQPVAVSDPVDLSDEFAIFDAQLDSMKSFADSLSGEDLAYSQPQAIDPSSPIVDNAQAQNPTFSPQTPVESPVTPTQDAIPLAGASGPTNPPTTQSGEEIPVPPGKVYSAQPQPGTGTITQVESSLDDDKSASEMTEQPQGQTGQAFSFEGEEDAEDFTPEDFQSERFDPNALGEAYQGQRTPGSFTDVAGDPNPPTIVGEQGGGLVQSPTEQQPGQIDNPEAYQDAVQSGTITEQAPPIIDETIESGGGEG